jgi:RHS repeat-associated protein
MVYDSYGMLLSSTDPPGNTTVNTYDVNHDLLSTTDPDLNLYYLWARYYNPVTGRFFSRDPAAGQITNPATLHTYLYARHDP